MVPAHLRDHHVGGAKLNLPQLAAAGDGLGAGHRDVRRGAGDQRACWLCERDLLLMLRDVTSLYPVTFSCTCTVDRTTLKRVSSFQRVLSDDAIDESKKMG